MKWQEQWDEPGRGLVVNETNLTELEHDEKCSHQE